MGPAEMRELLRKRPFEPFRLYVDDGRVFDIKYPHLNLVTDLRMVIGVPDPNDPAPWMAEHGVHLGWSVITKVEPLTAPAPTGKDQAPYAPG
jgi:hypothetical protein